MFGKEILKLVLYLLTYSFWVSNLQLQFVLLRGTPDKRKRSTILKQMWQTQVWKLQSVSHWKSLFFFFFFHTMCLLMSQRQNSLLITEDDVSDGNSCNGALLARINSIIMKLFQWCCCFKWTLKNWLLDSVYVLMGFKVIPYPFQFYNF